MRLSLVIVSSLAAAIAVVGCDISPEEAREKLATLQIPYTEASFVERAMEDDSLAIPLFLKAGMHADARDEGGLTPLMIMAARGHAGLARMLLDAGADPNSVTSDGLAPLLLAAGNGHTKVVIDLLDYGAELEQVDAEGRTPLHMAVAFDDMSLTKVLLEAGADVSKVDSEGRPPVWNAVRRKQLDQVDLMLHYGANLAVQTKDGQSILSLIDIERELEFARELLDRGADPNLGGSSSGNWPTILLYYIDSAEVNALRLLIEYGADVNRRAEIYGEEMTPLLYATLRADAENRTEVMDLLVRSGADVSYADGNGESPLLHAIVMTDTEAVRLLLDNGANTEQEFCGRPRFREGKVRGFSWSPGRSRCDERFPLADLVKGIDNPEIKNLFNAARSR